MNVVILQPSYIPWRGYFHQIDKADLFIFYDDVQYDKHGWRNRNQIKTPNGNRWLTIPVYKKGVVVDSIPINQIKVCWDTAWNVQHWDLICRSYKRAPYFDEYQDFLAGFYHQRPNCLADFTIEMTIAIARKLGINHTCFIRSSQLTEICAQKTDRLIQILQAVGATHYISGPSARDYIEIEKFDRAGITLEYMNYDYREYPQLHPPFCSQVSILDLLLMTGPEAMTYIKEG